MSLDDEFQAFWLRYPRKVGRLEAFRQYVKARKLASAEEILAGLERYRQHLPEELRFVPHARTWLYQGRWDDQYEELPKPKLGSVVPSADQTQAYLRRLREQV